ncbi:MAG: methyltransferase domain-containing protein [Planctomycetes bacterium]|nr:methyltransferase domain-containing protein [Planctomycetota bacterium]
MRLLDFAALSLLLFSCSSTPDTNPQPPERSAVPEGINDNFLDPNLDLEVWKDRWEVESREVYAAREGLVAALGLKPGERVADVGAGTGLYMVPFSESVGSEGIVYEADISPRFIEHLEERKSAEGLRNVRVHASTETSLNLPSDSIDAAFVCDTYHHFEYHKSMLASLRNALSRGGRLMIVDFERIPGVSREWVMGHVRAGKEQVRAEIEEAGFAFDREVDLPELEENYCMVFIKP